MMDREEWRTGILHACLQNDTCRIYDRAAARCTLDDTVRDCGYECCPYVQFNEAKEKMHAVSKAFRALVNHTDLKNALYSLDEGTAYVKRMYHSGEDDILRRDVND